MSKLIYSAITSLDGYVADEDGDFGWAAPDEEVHAFVNDVQRPVGTYLYGRRMYEVMVYWETAPTSGAASPAVLDFAAMWQDADKIVYSKTLDRVASARSALERDFDPGTVREMKASAARDLCVAGPTLAAEAFRADLVDEVHLFVVPAIVGGGTAALPAGVRLRLELLDHRRFRSGALYLHYAVGGRIPRRGGEPLAG